jgi:hypothetical protein
MQLSQSCLIFTMAYSVQLLLAATTLTILWLMLPMEELASLPLLWGRERIRESKRDKVSGSHSICMMMLNVSLVLSCQETTGSATCI